MLAWYAERLPTVEINNTFYRMPRTTVLESWSGGDARSLPLRDQGLAPHHAHRADQDRNRRRSRSGICTATLARSAQSAVPCCSSCRPTSRRTCRASPSFCSFLPDDHRARVRVPQRVLVHRRRLRRAQGRRGVALLLRARGQRAAAAGGDCASGVTSGCGSKRIRTTISKQWAARLEATSWRQIHVYFMHEPTAPAYANVR